MISVIGSINMDLVVNLPEIPRVGETVTGGVFMTNPGGKGANQATAAAKLGSSVAFAGCVGDDGFGTELSETLRESGADTTYLERLCGCASGVALIQVDAKGRNNIAVAPGANFALTKEHIDKAFALFEASSLALFQMEIPYEVNRYAMQKAHEAGCTVILNPSPVQALDETVLANTDIIIPNEHELARITGMPCASAEDIRLAAESLQTRGVRTVIVTLGGDGVLLLSGEDNELLPAYRVKAVDTTAAGDAFLGGFAHYYEKTHDLRAAVDFGQRVAAFSVQRRGAQRSMPTLTELEEA